MINEVKKSFRLIPYGYGVKMNLICGVIVFLFGLAELCTGFQPIILTASVFVILGPLVCLQITTSLLYSGIVAASPRRRTVEIGLGDALSSVGSLICYLLVACGIFLNKEKIENPAENMILASQCMAICVIYMGVAYKIYLIGNILYVIALLGGKVVGTVFFELTKVEFSTAGALIVSFMIMVLGVVLSSVFRRWLYKRRLSAWACGAGLRKALQS